MIFEFLLYAIVFIIILKYIIIILGYLGCCYVSNSAKKRNEKIDFSDITSYVKMKDAQISKELTSRKLKGKHILYKTLKVYQSRLINGWMRYSSLFTGKIPSHFIRNFIYKHIYNLGIAKNVVIYGGSEIRAPFNITIGEGTIIGDDSKLDGRNGIVIGKNVNLSTGVWIWTEQHNTQSPNFSNVNGSAPVVIKDRAWISCRVVILPGVTIGEGSVIAAGAVVTKNVEPFSIYGGIPAKKIGERNKKLIYEFKGDYMPFY